MLATDMTGAGSPEEKLRWAFRMYDKDNSGEKYSIKDNSGEKYFY